MAFDLAVLAVDGHAGEIADVLVGARELVKQRRLAAVLVADERKGQLRPFGKRLARPLWVEAAALAEARMLDGIRRRRLLRAVLRRIVHFFHGDLRCVGKAQRQFIAVERKLDRVAHRRVLHDRDGHAGDQPHIEKMLAKRPFAADGLYNAAFADFQILYRHGLSSVPFSPHSLHRGGW